MGRYYWNKKEEADRLKKIQIWWIKKYHYLNIFGNSGTIKWTHPSGQESSIGIQTHMWGDEKYMQLYYTQTDENGNKKEFNYKIPITSSPCNYGGKRYWFICPWHKKGIYCGRRVGVLYKADDYFACRHCYNLSYESRNHSYIYRKSPFAFMDAMFKAEKIEEQMKRRYYAGKPTKKYRKIEKLRSSLTRTNLLLAEKGMFK